MEVVKVKQPSASGSTAGKRSRRPRRSRTALVLEGGGFTGAVYAIGALSALDALAVNGSVNRFDIYVGTSGGSFVAGLVANGVTSEDLLRAAGEQGPTAFPAFDRGTLLRPNYLEFAQSAARLPMRSLGLARQLLPRLRSASAMDLLAALAQGLPSGLFDGAGIERYLRRVLGEGGRTDDFRQLEKKLYITATDLDLGKRIVFGSREWNDVPISRAVAASAALPMVYRPVEIRGRHLVDGVVGSTTNVDIAVEHGARLVIVVNPLVPYVNHLPERTPNDTRARRVADRGTAEIGCQALKLLVHQPVAEAVKRWDEKHPDVDIYLIEPEPDDELMFEANILDVRPRREIAHHARQSVTRKLARDFDQLKSACAKHGIEISATPNRGGAGGAGVETSHTPPSTTPRSRT